MREDMAKVLVERPRHGGGCKYPRFAYRGDPEQVPSREPIRSLHLRSCKYLNENLAPLRRFLERRIGCHWDSVYSEICERIDRDSAVQLHIWQHLMWEVERDPVKIEKLLSGRYRSWRYSFYVDPRSGRLCRILKRPAQSSSSQRFLEEYDGRSFKRIEGIWYEIEFASLPSTGRPVWDVLLSKAEGREHIDGVELKKRYGSAVYATKKRQLNTKEIRWLLERLSEKQS